MLVYYLAWSGPSFFIFFVDFWKQTGPGSHNIHVMAEAERLNILHYQYQAEDCVPKKFYSTPGKKNKHGIWKIHNLYDISHIVLYLNIKIAYFKNVTFCFGKRLRYKYQKVTKYISFLDSNNFDFIAAILFSHRTNIGT